MDLKRYSWLLLLSGCASLSVHQDASERFLGTWKSSELVTWMQEKPYEAISEMTIKKIANHPDEVSIQYTANGLGICEILGIAKAQGDRLLFNSWEPSKNRDLNVLILQRDRPCTLEISLTERKSLQISKVTQGCNQACGVHGSLERELSPSR